MDKCINTKHPEFIKLAKQVNMNPLILKSKIGVWQEKNNSDDFPTLEELGSNNNIKEGVAALFESNPELANKVYEALGFKEQQYVSKLKEISERRKLATKWDLENSQLIKDIRVNKTQPKTLKPNEADKNLASIMLYGHRYSDLSNGEYIDDNLSTITNPAEMQSEAELLAYRILNDFMFDMDELVFYQDILLENPEYASVLSTNENPVKEFFENDIFEQADKEKFEITPEQKQQAQQLYSQYLEQNPNGSVEQFKNWVDNSERQYSKVESNSIKDSKVENKVYETDVLIRRFPFSIKGNNTYSVEFINNTSKESYPISVVNDLVYSLNKNNKGKERFVYNPTEKEGYYVINKAVADSNVKPIYDRKGVTYNDINNINVFC